MDRRHFLKASLIGGLATAWGIRHHGALYAQSGAAAPAGPSTAPATAPVAAAAQVGLTTGDSRADNTFRALRLFEREIARAIGDKRVVIKPNNVSITKQLAATHVDSLEGILEFLKSIGKVQNAIIAESAAEGPTMNGFEAFKYGPVADKYGVKLVDLDKEPIDYVYAWDETDFRPKAVRASEVLLEPSSFIISAPKMKTHDRAVATLSLKNIVFGAPIKDPNLRGAGRRPGARNDKPIVHGNGIYGINYNLFALGQRLHPHLAVIDGFDGMEGNGPTNGTAVDHRVCVTSLDFLAADRVGVELMGIDAAKVGWLNYCADAALGQADLKKIEILGEPIARHIKTYKLSTNVEQQFMWLKPPAQS